MRQTNQRPAPDAQNDHTTQDSPTSQSDNDSTTAHSAAAQSAAGQEEKVIAT